MKSNLQFGGHRREMRNYAVELTVQGLLNVAHLFHKDDVDYMMIGARKSNEKE